MSVSDFSSRVRDWFFIFYFMIERLYILVPLFIIMLSCYKDTLTEFNIFKEHHSKQRCTTLHELGR